MGADSDWNIGQVLDAVRSGHPGILDDVADGNRVFWTGSGISRDIAPMLPEVIRNALVFLRDKIDSNAQESDPHFIALLSILDSFLPDQVEALKDDVVNWNPPSNLDHLANNYGNVFLTHVDGKEPDYLLWEAANVPHAFGGKHLAPGPDHFLLGLLILEGNVAEIASGNWDGLIELAVRELAGGRDGDLVVRITNDSFREPEGRAHLYKFHGCAVLALNNEPEYREYIVGREPHLTEWSTSSKFREVRDRMTTLARHRRTLFLGLSVQDSNLMLAFMTAAGDQPWLWDETHPAYVFTELKLSQKQMGLLERLYSGDYGTHTTAIHERSALGMYSRDVLAALVIHVINTKIRHLTLMSPLFSDDVNRGVLIQEGVEAFESQLFKPIASHDQVVRSFTNGLSAIVQYFTVGQVSGTYQPLFFGRINEIDRSSQPHRDRTTELSAVLTILGVGAATGRWRLELPTDSDHRGLIEIRSTTTGKSILLVCVRDATTAVELMGSSSWQTPSESIVMLQTSGKETSNTARSPGRGLNAGRNRTNRRTVPLETAVDLRAAPNNILDSFAEAIGA